MSTPFIQLPLLSPPVHDVELNGRLRAAIAKTSLPNTTTIQIKNLKGDVINGDKVVRVKP